MKLFVTAGEYDFWAWVPDPIREPLGYALIAVGVGLWIRVIYNKKFKNRGDA